MFFCTIKQTMVMVRNHANISTQIKYFLSDKAKPGPALIVLTLDERVTPHVMESLIKLIKLKLSLKARENQVIKV
jgi:hypothetical protein